MFLGKANKVLKTGSVQTINTQIKNIERIISSSKNHSCKLENSLILHCSRYPKTVIKRWDHNCTYLKRFYSVATEGELVDSNTFEKVCEETLCSLADYFEDLVTNDPKLETADVMYGAGVLTIDIGSYGTYVINRQSPNRQIWLSSPTSGPKRFDYLVREDRWIYKHDGQILHTLLKKEFENIIGRELHLSNCSHSSLEQ